VTLSPTKLTLRHLREVEGWPLVEVTEIWNPHARIRQDLFGFIDVLAVGPQGVLGVQTTSYTNVSSRLSKIIEHENLPAIREAGIAVRVHGWRKVGGRWVLYRDENALRSGVIKTVRSVGSTPASEMVCTADQCDRRAAMAVLVDGQFGGHAYCKRPGHRAEVLLRSSPTKLIDMKELHDGQA
jgi:hypothetical protein